MTDRPTRPRTRLSAEDRRRQLIGIGLRLLVSRPIHELSIDEVAAEAGISRGPLFHCFPTKRDYYIAVVQAAGRRMLTHSRLPDEGTPAERLYAAMPGFVSFVQRRRATYVALVRAGAGAHRGETDRAWQDHPGTDRRTGRHRRGPAALPGADPPRGPHGRTAVRLKRLLPRLADAVVAKTWRRTKAKLDEQDRQEQHP